jgi:hypothetical protein
MRHLRHVAPILLIAAAAFVAGNASGSVESPVGPPVPAAGAWKVCLDERIADYGQRDITVWPGLEECFRQP